MTDVRIRFENLITDHADAVILSFGVVILFLVAITYLWARQAGLLSRQLADLSNSRAALAALLPRSPEPTVPGPGRPQYLVRHRQTVTAARGGGRGAAAGDPVSGGTVRSAPVTVATTDGTPGSPPVTEATVWSAPAPAHELSAPAVLPAAQDQDGAHLAASRWAAATSRPAALAPPPPAPVASAGSGPGGAVAPGPAADAGWASVMADADAADHPAVSHLSDDSRHAARVQIQTESGGETVGHPGTTGHVSSTGTAGAILIVEDDLNAAKIYRMVLESKGFVVRHAVDGVAALDEVRRSRPDLVLLDVMLPRMNGMLFLQALRAQVGLRDVPVVILSNVREPQLVERAMALGAIEYIVKAQTRLEVLLSAVPRWMAGERALSR